MGREARAACVDGTAALTAMRPRQRLLVEDDVELRLMRRECTELVDPAGEG
jgi:hypothetical protein